MVHFYCSPVKIRRQTGPESLSFSVPAFDTWGRRNVATAKYPNPCSQLKLLRMPNSIFSLNLHSTNLSFTNPTRDKSDIKINIKSLTGCHSNSK